MRVIALSGHSILNSYGNDIFLDFSWGCGLLEINLDVPCFAFNALFHLVMHVMAVTAGVKGQADLSPFGLHVSISGVLPLGPLVLRLFLGTNGIKLTAWLLYSPA